MPGFVRPEPDPQIYRRMIEFEIIPRFRARSDWRVLQLRGVFENPERAGDRGADRVSRPPEHRQKFIFIESRHVPKTLAGEWQLGVGNEGGGFVRERRVNERVIPAEMALDPAADDG